MKTLFVLFLLSLSSQAFSKHNYYSETCTFDSIKGYISLYKRFYWEGFHSVITSDVPGLDTYSEVYLPGSEGGGDDAIKGDEAIVFSEAKDSNEVRKSYDDGCWQGFTASFDRSVKIKNIRDDVQKILELNSGDELTMKCSYEHLEVLGDACSEL